MRPFLISPFLVSWIYGSAFGLSFLSARSVSVLLLLFTVVGLFGYWQQNQKLPHIEWTAAYDWAIFAWAAYALLSLLWTPHPSAGALSIFGAVSVYFCTKIMLETGTQSDPEIRKAASRGVMAAVIVIGFVCSLDLITSRALSIGVLNAVPDLRSTFGARHVHMIDGKVVGISDAGIDRTITMLALCMLPAWLAANQMDGLWQKSTTQFLVLAICVAILITSTHQTSQASFIAAGLVWLAYKAGRKFGRAAILAGWTAAVFLVVPVSILALDTLKSNESKYLFNSARTRVVIWGMMAHDAVKSPIFGHGAASAENVETNIRIDAGRIIPVTKPAGGRISHPHSFYLQTWYELGAIGAALLFLTGASVIQAIWKQSTDRERFSAMQFATIAVMIAPSYGIWSFWFESGISLSIWACAMANYGRPDAPPALEPANGGSTA